MLDICLGSGFLRRASTIEQRTFLLLARYLGVRFFDTAQQYAPAEDIIGSTNLKSCRIITKIGLSHSLPSNLSSRDRWELHYPASVLQNELTASLDRLRRDSCYGLLLHCITGDIDFTSHIKELQRLKASGLVNNIGFSIDASENLPSHTEWADIVQIHVSHLNHVVLYPHQLLMVNGIFRDSAEKSFFEFQRKNRGTRLMMILGTHRFSRLIMQILKFRLFNHQLFNRHLI